MTSKRARRCVIWSLSILVIWATLLLAPAAQAAGGAPRAAGGTPAGSAWLRLGHLAPATGAVDVWLTPFGGTVGPATLSGVRYGSLSAYRALAPGFYTVAMRPAGSPAAAPAMVSATLRLTGSHAYSALAEGTGHTVTVRLTDDDLTAPAPGRARLRLIQAATEVPAVDVRVVNGPVLATNAHYASVTPYAQVPAGGWTVQLTAAGGFATTTSIAVNAGTVSTVLVLDGPGGSAFLRAVTDAGGVAVMPTGGVETGAGGSARSDGTLSGGDGLIPEGSTRVAIALLAGVICAGAWLLGVRRLRATGSPAVPS